MWVIMTASGMIIERDLRMEQAQSLCAWHNSHVDMARAERPSPTITLAKSAS